MSKAPKRLFAIGVLALIGALVVVLPRTRIDSEEHNRFQQELRTARQLDTLINEDALKIRQNILVHYDPLIRHLEQLEYHLAHAKMNIPHFISPKGRKELLSSFDQQESWLAEKEEIVEEFKSLHAISKNSLFYIPILSSQLAEKARQSENSAELYEIIEGLQKEVLKFNLASSYSLATDLQKNIDLLSGNLCRFSELLEPEELQLAVSHAEIVIALKPKVDYSLSRLTSIPTGPAYEAIQHLYGIEYESSRSRAQTYRFFVYLFMLLLVVGAFSLIILQLWTAQRERAALVDDLQTVNKELQEFAYVVSHDLKAPLRSIGSLAGWLASDYADKLDEDGREQLGLLQGRVKRMHGLIEGILQYSRVGRVREERKRVDLDELARDIVDLLDPPSHIEVVFETPLPALVCEETRIVQVFQNLLSNAIKFMDKPKGEIRIAARQKGAFWQFDIADNGPGISEKYFEKIFVLFQTLVARDDMESTGVGLTVVKKIVEMHEGEIWLESEEGKGTVFHFTLKAFLENQASSSKQAS